MRKAALLAPAPPPCPPCRPVLCCPPHNSESSARGLGGMTVGSSPCPGHSSSMKAGLSLIPILPTHMSSGRVDGIANSGSVIQRSKGTPTVGWHSPDSTPCQVAPEGQQLLLPPDLSTLPLSFGQPGYPPTMHPSGVPAAMSLPLEALWITPRSSRCRSAVTHLITPVPCYTAGSVGWDHCPAQRLAQ